MIIQPLSINTYPKHYSQPSRAFLKHYPCDAVSFGAIKKTELNPIDLYCAEMFKAPLEKLDNKKDFDRWAQKQFYEKSDINDYYSKFETDNIDRIYRLDVWKTNLKNNLYENNPAMALIILDSITSPLSPDNHEQPPIYNTAILTETVNYIKEQSSKNSDFQFCFRKLYENTLRHYVISGEKSVGKFDTKWIKIPSKTNDKENFNTNVKKLKILSSRTWCTKAAHARSYLEMGDIYIYYDKGRPKACIRMEENNVAEIECESNNCEISEKYINKIFNFIEDETLNTDMHDDTLLGGKFVEYKNSIS